jgi:hypothetical protein
MPATLSVESEITTFLSRHNLDAARFCAIVGPIISTTKLSQALNDFKPLDSEQATSARKTMKSIDRLVALCEPIPISLRNPTIIKGLLGAMEKGTLRVDVTIDKQEQFAGRK